MLSTQISYEHQTSEESAKEWEAGGDFREALDNYAEKSAKALLQDTKGDVEIISMKVSAEWLKALPEFKSEGDWERLRYYFDFEYVKK